jgi:hypothetical protein
LLGSPPGAWHRNLVAQPGTATYCDCNLIRDTSPHTLQFASWYSVALRASQLVACMGPSRRSNRKLQEIQKCGICTVLYYYDRVIKSRRIKSILLLHLYLPSGLLPSGFQTKILYAISSLRFLLHSLHISFSFIWK